MYLFICFVYFVCIETKHPREELTSEHRTKLHPP